MGTLTSALKMMLIDGVSGPAAKVRGALGGLDGAARKVKGSTGGALGGTILAGGGQYLMAAAGTYLTAGAAMNAFKEYATWDRRLTRIRQTADGTREEMKVAEVAIRGIARETGLAVNEVTGGMEALVAAGRSLPDAMAFLPAVARTAQASGAAVEDIAKTADAIGQSLRLTAPQMEEAFDILVAAGKAGKFELKDMAQYLPSIAASAGAAGLKGTEGLRKLAGMLQVIRNQTGSSSEAATALANVFQKMESNETANRFKKFGVDLPKAMTKARKEGKDLLDTFLDLADQAVKGDLSKLPQLISDAEYLKGVRALLSQREVLRGLVGDLKNAGGAVARDVVAPANDAAAAVTRMGDAWDRAGNSMARLADSAGATSLLEGIADGADRAASNLDRLVDNMKRLGTRKGIAAWFDENERAEEEARVKGERDARDLGLPTVENRTKLDAALAAISALSQRREKATGERDRLMGVAQRYGSAGLPPILQTQLDAALKAVAEVEGQLREVERLRDEAINASRPQIDTPFARGQPGAGASYGPQSGGTRPPNLPAHKMPSAASWAAPDPLARLPEQMDRSGEAAVAKAEEIARRINAAFDAISPVVRPRVEMPAIGNYGMGRSVSDGLNGSQSDNGGRR